jgi:hypothetical protein
VSSPTFVAKTGDVQCAVEAGDTEEVFSFPVFEISTLDTDRKFYVYEFNWTKLSHPGAGLAGSLRQSWQLLVGLPRIGFHALSSRPAGFSAMLLKLTQLAFCVSWSCAVVRMLVSLALIILMDQLKFSKLRYYDIVLPLDLATFLVLGLFSILFLASWVYLRIHQDRCALSIAALSLGFMVLFTHVVPLSVLELTGFDQRADKLTPWYSIAPSGVEVPAHADWFYYTDSLPGFVPYLAYGLIVLWACWTIGTGYWLIARQRRFPASHFADLSTEERRKGETVAKHMKRVIFTAGLFWGGLAFLVLCLAPVVWWAEFVSLVTRGSTLMALYDPEAQDAWNVFRRILFKDWVDYVTFPLFIIVWGLIFWAWLRKTLAPLLEVAFDLSSYFPPVPIIDDFSLTRFLFGGPARRPRAGSLHDILVSRLRAVVQFAWQQHGSHVVVVSHSMGSLVALSALEGWHGQAGAQDRNATNSPAGTGRKPEVELVTMGIPLGLMSQVIPSLSALHRGAQNAPDLPCVRRWLNLYRAADVLGRHVDGAAFSSVQLLLENELLGSGGHTGYFHDTRVAARILRWLYGSIDSARAVVNGAQGLAEQNSSEAHSPSDAR